MFVIAVAAALTGFGLAFWSFANATRHLGRSIAGVAAAIVLEGLAMGILHLIGR